jgi:excisionase family DNA binding protein
VTALLNVDQAAEMLTVSKDFIYKAVARRAIECYKVGHLLRFSEDMVRNYLARSRVPVEPVGVSGG